MSNIKFNKDEIYVYPDGHSWNHLMSFMGGESEVSKAFDERRQVFPNSRPKKIIIKFNAHFNGVPIVMKPPEETGEL